MPLDTCTLPPRLTCTMPPTSLPYFATCAPGLEPLLLAELRALRVAGARQEEGGVAFGGGDRALYSANLHLRTASRVLVRVATFHADSFAELERRADKVEWERWVAGDVPVDFRVTCRKSRLYHSDAVAERLLRSAARKVGVDVKAAFAAAAALVVEGEEDDDEHAAPGASQLFVVRLVRDELTLSADASGALLHRRGYRQAVGKAPLRETLAAAMLLGSGWTPGQPLLDPMCGAGTIAIEAALLARNVAPGLSRATGGVGFAFERWPGFDAALWERLVGEARATVKDAAPAPILASDRDAGAIGAARANAERAGVLGDITFAERALSSLPPVPAGGWLVTNPPYGARVGERGPLRALYARIGQVVAGLDGWSLALLSADAVLEGQVGLPLEERWRTSNGGIPVRLLVATAPSPD